MQCIEFPSILLPPGCSTGSIVSIQCSRNPDEERSRSLAFWDLQDDILSSFGVHSPTPPSLRLRNVTQTSVTLEWDRLQLATARLLSLTIWRNGQRLAAIPNPHNNTSTKVSGLDVDQAYSFHLIARTTAGTFSSQTIKTRTLTLSDTSGVSVCFGAISPGSLLGEAQAALEQMRAKSSNRIQIDTTHFVCTHAADGPTGPPASSGEPNPAIEFQRAAQLSIPIVHPSWVLACAKDKKMVPINQHYLDKAALSGGPPSQERLSRQQSSNASNQGQAHGQVPAPQARGAEPIQLQRPPRGRSSTAGSVDQPATTQQEQQTPQGEPKVIGQESALDEARLSQQKEEPQGQTEEDVAAAAAASAHSEKAAEMPSLSAPAEDTEAIALPEDSEAVITSTIGSAAEPEAEPEAQENLEEAPAGLVQAEGVDPDAKKTEKEIEQLVEEPEVEAEPKKAEHSDGLVPPKDLAEAGDAAGLESLNGSMEDVKL